MPSRVCTYPGCKTIVSDGSSRCCHHVLPERTPKRQYDHHYHNGKNIYKTSQWRKLRESHLRREPCCVMCAQYDIVTPATVVDHIVEIKDQGDPFDPNNLQSLCAACHNKKTGKEARKRREKKQNGGFRSLSDF